MKRWKIVSLLTIAALLIAIIPASANGSGAPYWELYPDVVPGEIGAVLIHPTEVRVYETYLIDCLGREWEGTFDPPWNHIRWRYEEGDVSIAEIGAYVSWEDPYKEGWVGPEWIVAYGDCEAPAPAVKVSCPTCGSPVWESTSGPQGDGMAMAWTSIEPCSFNMADWCFDLDSKVRAWSTIAFSFEYPANVFHVAEKVSGADGVTYFVLDVDDHIANNAIIWGPEGQGDRFRDHGPVYKYLACSIAPGFYDAPDGVALYKPGHTVSDWAKFLLDNDFFADEMFRGDAALEWANTLHDAGELALP